MAGNAPLASRSGYPRTAATATRPTSATSFTTTKKYEALELRCQRDDGIVVYLDGKQVIRENIEEGPDAYRLHSTFGISNKVEKVVHRFPVGVPLEPGDHILAISLHNTRPPSTDLRIAGITLVELDPSAESHSIVLPPIPPPSGESPPQIDRPFSVLQLVPAVSALSAGRTLRDWHITL